MTLLGGWQGSKAAEGAAVADAAIVKESLDCMRSLSQIFHLS